LGYCSGLRGVAMLWVPRPLVPVRDCPRKRRNHLNHSPRWASIMMRLAKRPVRRSVMPPPSQGGQMGSTPIRAADEYPGGETDIPRPCEGRGLGSTPGWGTAACGFALGCSPASAKPQAEDGFRCSSTVEHPAEAGRVLVQFQPPELGALSKVLLH